MTVALPAALSLCFELGTWREAENPHVDDDMTESGKPLRSKKAGSPLTNVSGSLIITHEDKMDWTAFFKTTCQRGALPFTAKYFGVTKTFWWMQPPEYSSAATRVRVDLALAFE